MSSIHFLAQEEAKKGEGGPGESGEVEAEFGQALERPAQDTEPEGKPRNTRKTRKRGLLAGGL